MPTPFLYPIVFVLYLDGAYTYLRIKFILPNIIFDPSLILSPHVFLLSLIFVDRVFAAPNLVSAS